MIYNGSPLLPLRQGYSPQIPYGATVLKLPSGVSQVRRETVKPITTVRAQYRLTSCFMIQWYKAWYRSVALEGGATFTARLAMDNAELADYIVQFKSAPTIASDGYHGILTCDYEILSRNPSDDCDYLAIYDEFGNCSSCSLETLNDAL